MMRDSSIRDESSLTLPNLSGSFTRRYLLLLVGMGMVMMQLMNISGSAVLSAASLDKTGSNNEQYNLEDLLERLTGRSGRGLAEIAASNSNDHNSHSNTPSTTTKPLLHMVASTYFPLDAETGKIALPEHVTTVVIDVGARESDYLLAVEHLSKGDHSVALIMVDPLPDSIIPLQQRAAEYALREPVPNNKRRLNPLWQDRVFTVRAAMGETEGQTNFKLSAGPACGSILETSPTAKFWCAKTNGLMPVQIYTLKDLLDLIPDRPAITSIHLKVDAEGADLIALKGAGSAIQRLDTVIIECQHLPKDSQDFHRKGECNFVEARDYMCHSQQICTGQFEGQDIKPGEEYGQGNVFFTNAQNGREHGVVIPPFLQEGPITFNAWYRKTATALQASTA